MNRSIYKAAAGIIVVTVLLILLIVVRALRTLPEPREPAFIEPSETPEPVVSTVTFLAFGDVNLGRTVGQRILKVDVHFPFRKYSIPEDSADIVFANLECQVSDQKGETGHPKFNLIFTAPPEAITTLKASGIDIVSTANNHAVDYGIDALKETVDRLTAANIPFVGTSKEKENLYRPLIYEKNNIKFAIFGVSAFVNMTFKGWRDHVAVPDSVKLAEQIAAVRDSVDVVILSYHGGVEYTDKPADHVKRFAEWSVLNGVDLFLGHHPHVTFGVQQRGKSIIVHSLGNFVFYQPQHYWTQRSYGIKFLFRKEGDSTSMAIDRFIPVNVSMQTKRLTDSTESAKLFRRTQQLSNFDLQQYWKFSE
ncbi:MAG: CapA family protein [Bacteroidetes bacterium]|nr:CapA family protein [Bacteroidota bacterium]